MKFYGNVRKEIRNKRELSVWENTSNILARAYDNPIPGYDTWNCISLRLWRSLPFSEFDFKAFN